VGRRDTPPAADELEVSVFGPLRGECVVLHIPGAGWYVVDSFTVRRGASIVPVATHYLRDLLGVDRLAGVLLTHWHEDHTEGARELLESFTGGVGLVGLPRAFSTPELATFVGAYIRQESGFRPVRDLLQVMDFLDGNGAVQRLLLGEGVQLAPRGAACSLEALSPSVEDERRLLSAIAAILPSATTKNTTRLNVNAGCAVLRIEYGELRIILASDLDAGDHNQVGWRHIVAQNHGALRAHVATIGHHGSPTAYHEEAWREIGDPANTVAISTLFPAKSKPLPREQVLEKVRKHTRCVLLTGHPGANVKSSVSVPKKHLPFSSYSPLHVAGDPGQVRIRYSSGVTLPSLEVFPPAHRWEG
jgi:hypothetical protein